MDLNNPIPQEWTSYVTQSPVGLEIVPAMLYDTLTFTSASTQELIFFNQSNVKEDISNLKQPGMLPNPQSFLIQNARIYFKVRPSTSDSGAAAPTPFASLYDDLVQIVNTGLFKLTIGTKVYGPYPLWTLPASTFVKGVLSMAGAEAANITQNYAQVDGPLYPLFPNLMIAPLQNFFVTLSWPTAAITLAAGNPPIEILLDGQLARAVQ